MILHHTLLKVLNVECKFIEKKIKKTKRIKKVRVISSRQFLQFLVIS